MRIGFEGPPVQPPGTAYFVQQYSESGFWFRPLGVVGPGNGFIRRAALPSSGWPVNGTTYLQASMGDSLVFSTSPPFDLLSVDLAEFSIVVSNAVTVPFIGYRHDGSIVSTNFTTDGIIVGDGFVRDFQTFYFGAGFRGLDRVEIPTFGWSLDNVYVSVPEPGSAGLMLAGKVFLLAWRATRNSLR